MHKAPAAAEIPINKPTPIKSGTEFASFTRATNPQETIDHLLLGKHILIEEFYSNGLDLMNELQAYLRRKHPNQGFQEQRAYRSEYRELSSQVLMAVNAHELVVKKAPLIG